MVKLYNTHLPPSHIPSWPEACAAVSFLFFFRFNCNLPCCQNGVVAETVDGAKGTPSVQSLGLFTHPEAFPRRKKKETRKKRNMGQGKKTRRACCSDLTSEMGPPSGRYSILIQASKNVGVGGSLCTAGRGHMIICDFARVCVYAYKYLYEQVRVLKRHRCGSVAAVCAATSVETHGRAQRAKGLRPQRGGATPSNWHKPAARASRAPKVHTTQGLLLAMRQAQGQKYVHVCMCACVHVCMTIKIRLSQAFCVCVWRVRAFASLGNCLRLAAHCDGDFWARRQQRRRPTVLGFFPMQTEAQAGSPCVQMACQFFLFFYTSAVPVGMTSMGPSSPKQNGNNADGNNGTRIT